MPISDADLEAIRDNVGSEPADEVIEEFYDRLGSVAEVSRAILSRRLQDAAADPSFNVSGVYSEDHDTGIRAMQATLKDLNAGGANAGVATTIPMVRPGRRR